MLKPRQPVPVLPSPTFRFDGLLQAIDFVLKNDDPAHGEA